MEMIKVDLTEDDALLFRAFKEHQDNFSVLLASGAFNVRSGRATLHFNNEGVLDSVDVEVPTYRRGHKQIQFLSLN
jgi:hypothetical protein